MKKRFVTITAGNHPDWSAEDWKNAWAEILRKIDTTKDDIFISGNVEFTSWNIWMGCDPPYPTSDHVRVNLEVKQAKELENRDKDVRIEKKLRSFGISEKSFIVKDGKVFINSPVIDSIIVKP